MTLSRSFAARLHDIAPLVEWVRRGAGPELTSHSRWNDFELAIVEATTNIIVHALREVPGGTIKVEICRNEEHLRVTLSDQGRAMPPALLHNPILPQPLATSGRGLWLIRNGADDVLYTAEPDGNELRLIFRPAQRRSLPSRL